MSHVKSPGAKSDAIAVQGHLRMPSLGDSFSAVSGQSPASTPSSLHHLSASSDDDDDTLSSEMASVGSPTLGHHSHRRRHPRDSSLGAAASLSDAASTSSSPPRVHGSSPLRLPPLGGPRPRKLSSTPGAVAGASALPDGPTSYFNRTYCGKGFSALHEWKCFVTYCQHLRMTIDEDRLPWLTDFLAVNKMRKPKNAKEAMSRLNLNIPYYAANYLQIFYVVAFPFLLFYNTPVLLATLIICSRVHSISIRKKQTNQFGNSTMILGRTVTYHTLAHILLAAHVVLCMFFNGLRTLCALLLIAVLVVVPHAVMRKTTFFDDEDMEKCRPKLYQYALSLVFLALCYLEGASGTCDMGDEMLSPSTPRAQDGTKVRRTSATAASASASSRMLLSLEEEANTNHAASEKERERLKLEASRSLAEDETLQHS